VEYFTGDSSIFVFVIGKDKRDFYRIKKDFPLDEWVMALRTSISGDYHQSQVNVYANMSFGLYEKLIGPIKDRLSEDLIIVPDGILGYVPFEALLTQKPEKGYRFEDHDYFVKDHSIGYSFSATLLNEMKQKKHRSKTDKPLIAYAPYFDGDTVSLAKELGANVAARNDFKTLANSGKEAYLVAREMNGEAIVGKEATVRKFIETAPSAGIIHLATHGQADDKSGDYSFLAFAPEAPNIGAEPQNPYLYVRDLYNQTLNADLVVLSACETGIGKLRRGEGVISLARAFAYAGAKSIVTSLWPVNDLKTKELMLLFYRSLKKGKAKDAALREAKLGFIGMNKGGGANPYFWAGFIGIGDMSPVR